MIFTISIFIITIVLMILAILFKPTIKKIETFWLVSLLGAFILLITNTISLSEIITKLTENTAINPLKILILFISMSILSIILDQVGFFKYCAMLALKHSHKKQINIFISIFVLTSILTIFTSNDIIILTFTPFICYFAKEAKINPIPYLVMEFMASNTWSMMLIIGNPTNIYLATSFNIDFFQYFMVMFIPTMISGMALIIALFIKYRIDLLIPLENEITSFEKPIKSRFLLIVGLIHLFGCLIFLIISSYIDIEMWLICFWFAISLILISLFHEIFIKRRKPFICLNTFKKIPWSLIPFILSMFIIVMTLNKYHVPKYINAFFLTIADDNLFLNTLLYGFSSIFSANIMNNIPMSVLYSNILDSSNQINVYITIMASNIGAYLTPIGALAGIMWMNLLKEQQIKFSFSDFIKNTFIIGIIIFTIGLLSLYLILKVIS